MHLPNPQSLFPRNSRGAIAWFWAVYWFWFFAYLPFMLVRQLGITWRQLYAAILTSNRTYVLNDGDLRLIYWGDWRTWAASALFGERFFAIHDKDVLIDPLPVRGRRRIEGYLHRLKEGEVGAVVISHFHEEHMGNAVFAAEPADVPVYGTERTLQEIRHPSALSLSRRWFMGQGTPAPASLRLSLLGSDVKTARTRLKVVDSPGHCQGHVSFYEEEGKILFAADSFLHEIFTAPNGDVDSAHWAQTLETYVSLDIRMMLDGHGNVYTLDPGVPSLPGVVIRKDPNRMVRDKYEFTAWARTLVAEGEARGLPYSVIEACLFPWNGRWSWANWFVDESFRLFTGGEFSRTHFIRSLSKTPERVPSRFPRMERLMNWLGKAAGWQP